MEHRPYSGKRPIPVSSAPGRLRFSSVRILPQGEAGWIWEGPMPHAVHGHLVPVGGGDNIPLIRSVMTLGRRDSCDICLRFPNISGRHCELSFREGYWFVRDLNSTNGIKVN